MIIYFYLFIPLLSRLAECSSTKGRNHKNDLVPFLSSRLDTQKDNSLKIVSNEPFIIQFQMPPESKENVHNGAKSKDKKKRREDKKRVSKIKPLRKKIRTRRNVSEAESRKEKPDQSTKLPTEVQSNQNQTQTFISRQEMLKALNIYLKKKETKKVNQEGMKNIRNEEKTDVTSSRNLHRNHSPSLPDHDPHIKMIYPKTPKSDPHSYSYKDLIADRERLEKKINYIRNMLHVNDSTPEDPVRIRRKSDSDSTANKIAKAFLTLSAVNGLHEKKSKCRDDDDDRVLDVWEKESKKSSSRQSSSSNEERYKIKKWIEYMKSKRSSGKTCPCMNEYNEDDDIFPLEQKLAKDYVMPEASSSEEYSDKYRDPLSHSRGKMSKSGPIRNSYKEDARNKFKALTNRGRRKYDLSVDDLELYRSRAKQILQNAEEILDKIKEEEERRLAAPYTLMSHLKELTSRIQENPRNNENDLINIIQKNLGWAPQSKSQPSTDKNTFAENIKSFILGPYEKAKALTDESTRKLTSYLLRNLGKIDSSEEEEEAAGKTDQKPEVFHGQVPQTEEMFSANLARENSESDLMAKEREEHQNWSDTLSAILGGNDEDSVKENPQGCELKQTNDQKDIIKKRVEGMIKEQEKKIGEHTEKPNESKIDETTIIDLMTGESKKTPKSGNKLSEDSERREGMLESEKQDENVEKSGVNQNNGLENESETIKSTTEETASDVIASEYQLPSEEQSVMKKLSESVGKSDETEGEDDKIRDFPSELQTVKAVINDDSTKEDETVAKNLEESKELNSAGADENQDENAKDIVMETGSIEKGTKDEEEQAFESTQKQDDDVQGNQNRKENDVLNSKHSGQKSDERSKEENLETFTQEIPKQKENIDEQTEESADKSAEYEQTIVKKKHDFSGTEDPEESVEEVISSPVSVKLQGETTSEETKKEFSSESNASLNGVEQTSQDPKESLRYGDSEKDKPSMEKENLAEGFVENVIPENSALSLVKSERHEDNAENIVEEVENSRDIENERMHDNVLQKTKSIEEGNEKEDDEKVREESDDEKLREELDNEKVKEIDDEKVREKSDDEKASVMDNEKVREELEDEKVREESDDEKVREEFDNEKEREVDDGKVKEESDNEKVREEFDNEKVREELEDEKVREESDDEKVREESDDEKVREESDDEKEREEFDNEKEREVDDGKVKEESDDEKVREELDNEKVKEIDDGKVKEESDNEKVRQESNNENVKEEFDNEKVREESDDERVREESDDEKVKEESDNENVKEEFDNEKVREESDDEKVREELDNEEKGNLRESLNDAEKDETNQEKSFLKSSSEESVKEDKSRESFQLKYLEESEENADEIADESTVRSENEERSNAETALKADKQSQEDNEEVDGTANNETSPKTLKSLNTDEIEDTISKENLKAVESEEDNEEKDEPQVKAELREEEETDLDNEKISLRSENPEKDIEISKETLMNISGNQEKVEAERDEAVNEESRETDKNTEEIASAEVEKVEQSKDTENMEEYSKESNLNADESREKNKTPKLLMSIKENLFDEETMKENQEEKNEGILNASEADDPKVENKNMNEEVQVRASDSEADQEQSEVIQNTQERYEEDGLNVRAESIKDLDNQIEDGSLKNGELRSVKADSEELNEDRTLKMNSLEQKDLDENVEKMNRVGPETEQMTLGKKKNALASEEDQGQSKRTLKVPKSIGKIMRDLDGKEKDDYASLTNLNPEKIDHIIDKIDEAEHRNKMESDDVDCRKECACADEMNVRSRNMGRYEIAKDFLHWMKDLQINRILTNR